MIKNILKMRNLDWIIMLILTLSYTVVDFKHPFYANNLWTLSLDIYDICPNFFNVLFFPLSLFILLKSNYLITKNLDKWLSLIFLFLYINPLTWKNLFIPVNNFLFSLAILFSTLCFIYIRSHNLKKELVIPFFLLIISFSLINSYFIIYFCSISVITYFLNLKQKDEYLKIMSVAFLIALMSSYFICFHNLNSLSDGIALFIRNTKSILYSFWGFLLLFSIIGLIIGFTKNYKNINKDSIVHFLFIVVLVFMVSFTTLFHSNIFPYPLLIVIGIICLYQYTPLIGKIFAAFLLLFLISSFFSVIDNYQKNMEFKETMIQHIVKANKEYKFQVIIGDIPDSPEITHYNYYPDNFFYQNPDKYEYIMKQKGLKIIFINKNDINHRFNIYHSEKIKDFKYFTIYKQYKISYLYIKKSH